MMIWMVTPLRCFLNLKKKTSSSSILIKQRIGVIHLIRSPLILIHSLHQSRRHATVGSGSKSLSSSAILDQRVVRQPRQKPKPQRIQVAAHSSTRPIRTQPTLRRDSRRFAMYSLQLSRIQVNLNHSKKP